MAKHGVFKDAYLNVNGIDFSDHVESLTFVESSSEQPSHAMGDDYEYNKPGLFKIAISANFFQDFAAGSVDATLDPLWRNRTEFNVLMRPSKTNTVSATNPMYSGLAFISSYQPIGGAHGANLMAPVSFSPAGNWSRLTT